MYWLAPLQCRGGEHGDLVTLQQQPSAEKLTWMGQPAHHVGDLTLESVLGYLPAFERQEFGENEYLDVVLRLPFGGDSRTIPVGSVSKRYFLVQHSELVRQVGSGLQAVGIKP